MFPAPHGPVLPRGLDAARRSISTIFLLNGMAIGLWAAHVPVVQAKAQLGTATLGLLLLSIAIGAMCAMPLSGRLATRFGNRSVTVAMSLALAVATVCLMNVHDVALLFACAWGFGVANGGLDVAMNANAAEVEKARGLPTMSSFHAFFSLGGLLGAALGGLMIQAGYGNGSGAALQGAVMVAIVAGMAGALMVPPRAVPVHTEKAGLPRGRLLYLGVLALLCMMVEGALVDWSAILLRHSTGVSAATAALGFSAFSVTMTACRFAGDRMVGRFGAARVMAFGGAAIFAGLALAASSSALPLSAAGLALVGLGAANVVPVIFSAAANTPGTTADLGMASVATVGYTGFLMGPPAIGWVTAHTNITVAVGLLSLAGLVLSASAAAVGARRPA
jgi:MFS family permease